VYHVSAKTVASVNLIEWGLQRLFDNLKEHDYQVINLLSCMTLDVENCHSTVHIKQANMSMMEYSRSFGLTMKESIKRVTQWAAYYHTSRKSWYPKPEETIPFSKVPTMQPLPIVKMSQANCDVLRNWASTYGAAVRQRTVCQETTMAKHGTLPEFMYQRKCVTLDTPVTIESGECRVEVAEEDAEDDLGEPVESADQESQDEFMDEFDTSSDEEESTAETEPVSQGQGEIGSSLTFLIGARSRFGRATRFNNRLLN
jgi:hypothetical protein